IANCPGISGSVCSGISGSVCSGISILVIVDTALLVYVGYFEVDTPFTGPYLPDTFQEFVKVVLAKAFSLFKPFIVQNKALDYELSKRFGSPNPELGSLMAVYPVAHGYYGIQIVKLHIPLYHPGAFLLNCFQNGNSCLFVQFARFVNITQVFVDCRNFHTK